MTSGVSHIRTLKSGRHSAQNCVRHAKYFVLSPRKIYNRSTKCTTVEASLIVFDGTGGLQQFKYTTGIYFNDSKMIKSKPDLIGLNAACRKRTFATCIILRDVLNIPQLKTHFY